jgi:acyl dehydratase
MSNAKAPVNGSWSDAVRQVGQTIGTTRGPETVTLADIRRKLEVIGLDCPLHYDAACAKSLGYRTVVSPVSMTRAWTIAPNWLPGQPAPGGEPHRTLLPSADTPGHGDTIIAAQLSIEHREPVYPGDRVSGTAVLRGVTPKTTRVGPGAFLEVETTYTNQHAVLLAVEAATLFRFDRGTGPDRPAPAPAPAPTADPSRAGATGFGRVAGERRYEDVRDGEALTEIGLPITRQRLVMEAAANRDFSPWHFDDAVARALGAPSAFANTTLIETLLEAAVRSWGRLGARIRRMQFRMSGHNCVGDLASIGGRVSGREQRGAERLVTLELWIDSPRGRTATGTAVVALPSRGRT